MQKWIETAQELGGEIPTPKNRLILTQIKQALANNLVIIVYGKLVGTLHATSLRVQTFNLKIIMQKRIETA